MQRDQAQGILTKLNILCMTNSPLLTGTGMYIKGQDVTKLASMAKLKGGRLCRELGDSCLQYWGGMGFTSDVLVSRFYR